MRLRAGWWFGPFLWLAWSAGCTFPYVIPPPDPRFATEAGVWGAASGIHQVSLDSHSSRPGCSGESEYYVWRERRQMAATEIWGRTWIRRRGHVHLGLSAGTAFQGVWRSAGYPINHTFWDVTSVSRAGLSLFLENPSGGGMVMDVGIMLPLGTTPMPDSRLGPASPFLFRIPLFPVALYLSFLPDLAVTPNLHVYPLLVPAPGFGGLSWSFSRGNLQLFFMPPLYWGYPDVEGDPPSVRDFWKMGMLMGGVSFQIE